MKTLGGTALISSALAGCQGGGGGGGDDTLTLGFETHATSGGWATAMMDGIEWYAEDRGFEFEIFTNGQNQSNQISNINQMVNQGYDGMVVTTFDTEGAVGAIEDAVDEGVPVYTIDSDAATDAVDMHVSYDDRAAASRSGELLSELMNEQHPETDEYEVLVVRAPPGRDIAAARHEPFVETIEGTDGVSIAGVVDGEWGRGRSQEVATQWINSNSAPDGVYAASYLMGLGAQDALASLDLDATKDSDDHITQVQIDGSPESHDMIADGYIDAAIDQPVHYYGPLALNHLAMQLNEGEDALPSVGDTVTRDDVTVEPAEHNGQTIWENPIWAPAEVRTVLEHKWLQTSFVEITEENVDNSSLWGNIWDSE